MIHCDKSWIVIQSVNNQGRNKDLFIEKIVTVSLNRRFINYRLFIISPKSLKISMIQTLINLLVFMRGNCRYGWGMVDNVRSG